MGSTSASVEDRAVAVIDRLAAGDFEGVVADFDETMARALSAQQLRMAWDQSMAVWGPFRNTGQVTTESQGGFTVAVVECEGEQSNFRISISFDPNVRIGGLFIQPPEHSPLAADDAAKLDRVGSILKWVAPVYILVPVAFLLAGRLLWDVDGYWGPFFVGTLGWTLALGLRAPVGLIAKRMSKSPRVLQNVTVASSGPLEELTRLVLLLVVGTTFSPAYMLGLGWASIEVLYAVGVGFVTANLARREDDRGAALRAQFKGSLDTPAVGPVVGILERVSASAIHIGFALMIAFNPLLVLVAIPLHSATNMTALKFRDKLAAMQAFVFVVGVAVLAAALLLHDKLG